MKRNVYSLLSVLAMAMVIGLPQVQAQSRLVANVPFNFCVNQNAMASGQYEVLSLSQQLAEFRDMDTDAVQIFIKATRVQSSDSGHARLIFNKYGDQYFLSEIWDGSSDTGIRLPKSQREKEVSLAGNRFSDGPETVIVAMN